MAYTRQVWQQQLFQRNAPNEQEWVGAGPTVNTGRPGVALYNSYDLCIEPLAQNTVKYVEFYTTIAGNDYPQILQNVTWNGGDYQATFKAGRVDGGNFVDNFKLRVTYHNDMIPAAGTFVIGLVFAES